MATDTSTASTGHMTLWEHIAELRTRLFRVALAVGIGAVLGWFLYPHVLEILKHPFNEVQPGQPFIATEPLQAFGLRLKMSAYIGTPTSAASGTDHQWSCPMAAVITSSGIQLCIAAPTPTPSST